MNIKASSVVALLAFAAAPLSSQAADSASNAAFDACVKAFSTSIPNVVRNTKLDTSYSSATVAYYKPSSYTIALKARGVESRSTVAQARCVVNNESIVLIHEGVSPGYSVEVLVAER
jgi:hypothetical protein